MEQNIQRCRDNLCDPCEFVIFIGGKNDQILIISLSQPTAAQGQKKGPVQLDQWFSKHIRWNPGDLRFFRESVRSKFFSYAPFTKWTFTPMARKPSRIKLLELWPTPKQWHQILLVSFITMHSEEKSGFTLKGADKREKSLLLLNLNL